MIAWLKDSQKDKFLLSNLERFPNDPIFNNDSVSTNRGCCHYRLRLFLCGADIHSSSHCTGA
jgi:hypothetical protein